MKKNIFIILLFIFAGILLLQAQNNHQVVDSVYIAAGGWVYISTGDTVRLEGNMATARNSAEAQRGMISFNGTSGWSSSNSSFVDGYVRSQKPGTFVFPVGQGGNYCPAAISKAAANAPTDVAYYSSALYDIAASDLDNELIAVTNESWIIQGTTAAAITLSWSTNLPALAENVKQLCVAGWDNSIGKWVMIPSAHEATSSIFGTISDLTQGTVSTTSEVVPNDYAAYTLGFTKPLYILAGTVFPFVHDTLHHISPRKPDTAFNSLFTVTARLYAVPQGPGNPILALHKSDPLHETRAVYYDGSVHVSTAPLKPGKIGLTNNPGVPIYWEELGKIQETVDTTKLHDRGVLPNKPIGLYTFDDVEGGSYILALSAPGFVTRYAKIEVARDESLHHRELISGDLNNDGLIDQRDATWGNAKLSSYPGDKYKLLYDINKDRKGDALDIELISKTYFGFMSTFYKDTREWIFGYSD